MSLWLVGAIGLLTYLSRAVAMVAMPRPSSRFRMVLDRVPAPLFAALAAISLFDDGDLAGPRTLVAAAGALAFATTRSLLWCLAGGMLGYGVATLLW